MPRQYTEQLRTPDAPGAGQLSTPATGTQIGDALRYTGEQIGRAGQQVSATREQIARQQYEATVKSELQGLRMERIRLQADNADYFDQLAAGAPEDGAGLVEQVASDMGKQRQDVLSRYTTPEAQAAAREMHAELETRVVDAAKRERAGRLANVSTRKASDSLGAAKKLVFRDAGLYESTVHDMADMVQGLAGLDADQKARLIVGQGREMAMAAGEGAVGRDPAGTLKDLQSGKPKALWAQHLELEDQQRLTSAAEAELARREAAARAARGEAREILRQDEQDAFAAKQSGLPASLPSRDKYIAAYGAEGAARYSKASKAFQVFDIVSAAVLMPPDEAAAQLAKLAPTTQAGAADQAQVAQQAAQLYAQQRKAFEDDPAGTLMRAQPALLQLFQGAAGEQPTPEAAQAYATKAIAAQQAAGIANPVLLPARSAELLARQLQPNPEKPGQRAMFLAQLEQTWGKSYGDVLRQVAPKLDGIGQILPFVPGRTAARLDALSADPKPVLETLQQSGKKADVESAVTDVLEDFDRTMPAGVVMDGPQVSQQYRDAITLYAADLVRGGQSPKKAAAQAYSEIIGSQYVTRGTLRIPVRVGSQPVNPDAVEAGAREAARQLAVSGDFKVEPVQNERPEDAQADMRELVRKEGFWIASGDESAAVLALPTGVVLGADGRPVTRTWAQLEEAAAARRRFDQETADINRLAIDR